MNSFKLLIGWIIISSICTVLFFATMIFFFGVIKLQTKIWFLARRGFHLVEHIGMNKVRTYFYLRPKDNKFDFKDGFYIHYPDATTKTQEFMQKTPKGYTFRKISEETENGEYKRMEETVKKMIFNTDAVTLRFGIPIITYVGNSPYPVNFKEPEKEYGAQVIRDVYIRLLATEQYGFMRKVIIYGMLLMMATVVILFLFYMVYKNNSQNLGTCINMWNTTQQQIVECTNKLTLNLMSTSINGTGTNVII